MKTFLFSWSGLFMVSILAASTAWCHGVEGFVDKAEAYRLTAQYDDGEPVSYAAVEIKSPDADIAFQTGRTDRNGCFLVKTDTPGAWQAVISDGMGHRLALDFTVAADGNVKETENVPASSASRQISRPYKVLTGLSLIIGLCGFFYGWKSRRPVQV